MTTETVTTAGTVRAIAAHLPGWEFYTDAECDYSNPPVFLVHADTGATVSINRTTYGADAGKLSATVSYPVGMDRRGHTYGVYADAERYAKPNRWRTSINMSGDRSPVALAKDLSRRLLPQAIEFHALGLAAVAAADAAADAKAAAEKRIIAEVPNASAGHRGEGLWWRGGSAEVSYDGSSVRIERLSNLSLEKAIAVMRLIGDGD